MATKRQISCINKPDRQNIYTPIINVGGIEGITRWKLSETAAIATIENKQYEYFVVDKAGNKVEVIIATRNGKKYLRTAPDDGTANNLLSLPECPA